MRLAITAAAAVLAISTAAHAQHDHGAHATAPAAGAVTGLGVVKSVDAKAGSLVIDHEPIKALNWGPMVMPFKVADPAILKDVKAGQKVSFQLQDRKIVAIQPR